MATGDENNVLARLKSTIPRWFGDTTPILDALLKGLSKTNSFVYSLYSYAALQTRIRTASDGFLDMISADFFGTSLPRKANQSDASFRAAIIAALFRERATRNAIVRVLKDVTGVTPRIFEPKRPADTGGYGIACGYGVAGGYGSIACGPYQAFVTAFRPTGTGIPNIAGYGIPTGAYRTPSRAAYAALSMIENGVTDQDIYDAIDSVKPAGTVIWVRLDGNVSVTTARLDIDFYLDISHLS